MPNSRTSNDYFKNQIHHTNFSNIKKMSTDGPSETTEIILSCIETSHFLIHGYVK